MSYHGYVPGCAQLLTKLKSPAVLEIGIDRGVTLIPLVTAMAGYCESFMYLGIDVNVQEQVKIMVSLMPQPIATQTHLIEENSLTFLPKLVEQNLKFDLILIDGDHNYHTVSNELTYVNKLVSDNGIVIIDDYSGRWSERDLWYADRPGYEENNNTTSPVETTTHGVKPAVDEWLLKNPEWKKEQPIEGEPILLRR